MPFFGNPSDIFGIKATPGIGALLRQCKDLYSEYSKSHTWIITPCMNT